MSLRTKIVLLLSAVVLGYAGLDHILIRTWVYQSFNELEQTVAQKDVGRVNDGIKGEVEMLARDCEGWAKSEKVRVLVTGHGPFAQAQRKVLELKPLVLADEKAPPYVEGLARKREYDRVTIELEEESARISREFKLAFPDDKFARDLQLVCVCDAKGTILHSRVLDPDRPVDVTMVGFMVGDNLVKEALISAENKTPIRGMLESERSLVLVSSQPIHSAPGDGHPVKPIGTLIVGRFLASVSRMISARVGVGFEAISARQESMREHANPFFTATAASGNPELVEVDTNQLDVYWCYLDVRGKPTALLHAGFERPITAQGGRAVRYALVSTIAAGLLLMLVLLNLVQRTILEPLGQLTEHAVHVGRSEDFTKRIRSDREDEVGILAREFDGMIERVAESRAALVDTARAAGMSEIATGVLHNVGNVLNSVNVSARIAIEKAKGSASNDLQMVMETLRPAADDLGAFIQNDPRGKHLFPLLNSLSDKIVDERAFLAHELETLSDGIEHIKQLVHSQQGYAGRAGVRETVSLPDLIDNAISITSQAASATAEIQVQREYCQMDSVSIDRHRVMEILVNLIQNARQSVVEARVDPARLTIRLNTLTLQRIRIEVVDNGLGIAPENIARIFTHGFTTKKNGHGFGLHASANAATEMGGNLSAHSDGKGLGATFALELPLMVPATARVMS